MGLAHKLKPEIKDYILKKKKEDPLISCRRLESLIEKDLKARISKSSINAIFKEANLSLPIGRRSRKPEISRIKLSLSPPILESIIKPQEENIAPPTVKEAVKEQIEEKTVIPESTVILPEVAVEKPVKEIEPVKEEIKEEAKPELREELKEETKEEVKEIKEEIVIEEKKEIAPKEEEEIKQPIKPQPVKEEAARIVVGEFTPKPFRELEGNLTQTNATIVLKAIDSLFGLSLKLNDRIYQFIRHIPISINLTDALLYSHMFDQFPFDNLNVESGLWPIAGKVLSKDALVTYLTEIKSISGLPPDLIRIILANLQEVRGIKVSMEEGAYYYLDGSFRTVWSTPYLPKSFSLTLNKTKSYIVRDLGGNSPFVLFMAPGYEAPSKEFFDFLLSLDSPAVKKITSISLFGLELEELDKITLVLTRKNNFILGLWPWQFSRYRKVLKVSEYRPYTFVPLSKNLFIADVDLELMQNIDSNRLRLRGCALKNSLADKARLVILTNAAQSEIATEELINSYLSRWPGMDESFADFSRKVELSTYSSSNEDGFGSKAKEMLAQEVLDIISLLHKYLEILDLYVNEHILPPNLKLLDFSARQKQFYGLISATLQHETNCVKVKLTAPQNYPFLKELEYVCSRLNEHNLLWPDGRRYWFIT